MTETNTLSQANATELKSYAVIRTGGKQYRVSPGESVSVEKLEGDVGQEVLFTEVLLLKSGDKAISVGTPTIVGVSVKAKIVSHDKAKKVLTYKKRRRKGYEKKIGHRQHLTRVLIEAIS